MNPKDQGVLDVIVEEIRDFEAELASEDANRQVNEPDYVREQLELLFDLLCDLSQFKHKHKIARAKYVETDRTVLEAWRTALSTIRALSSWVAKAEAEQTSTRHHFITARMLLFLVHALNYSEALPVDMEKAKVSRERVRLQMTFFHELDETLLSHLRAVWEDSGRRDTMTWATTHLASPGLNNDDGDSGTLRADFNRAAMRALSPAELWMVPGMSGVRHWFPADGDEPIYDTFPNAVGAVYGKGPKKNGKQPIIRQTLASDGPLRADNQFCLFKGEDEEWLRGPRLARSLQFVIDVRQYLYPWLVKERQRLAGKVGKLPNELVNMVATDLKAIESPDAHPYLSHLDLADVYASFPAWETVNGEGKSCEDCGEASGTGIDVRHLTCPAASIYIWNRGLRAFHTFHRRPKDGVVMCADGAACTGHHEDDKHEIKKYRSFEAHLESILQSRCGPEATFDSVGLGARDWLRDHVQRYGGGPLPPTALKTYGLDWSDVETVMRACGGWLSLPHAMIGEMADMPCFEDDGECRATTRMKTPWSWSRDEDEEDKCRKYLSKLG